MKPQSALTRRVFRAIVANRPYHSIAAPVIPSAQPKHHGNSTHVRSNRPVQRRDLFGLAIGSVRPSIASRPKTAEVALEKLAECLEAKRRRARPPPSEDLVEAIRALISFRREAGQGLSRNDVLLANEAFTYLAHQECIADATFPKTLGTTDLLDLLSVMARPPSKSQLHRSDVQVFAALVHKELITHNADAATADQLLASALASSGAAEEALAILERSKSTDSHAWSQVLRGLDVIGQREQVQRVLESIKFDNSAMVYSSLIRDASKYRDVNAAQRLLKFAVARGLMIEPSVLIEFLWACVRVGTSELGQAAAESLQSEVATPGVPGALLSWTAARGADMPEIEHTIQQMLDNGVDVNMSEINQLVKYAYVRKDAALADAYIQLAQSIGAVPDAETYALKLSYELGIKDLTAAREAFEGLCIQDVPEVRADIPALNRYISLLSQQQDVDFQLIMRVVDRLIETKGTLEAVSLAALTSLYLRRNEVQDAVDLLRPRINNFFGEEREKVAVVFKNFITDPAVKPQQAFNAYELFRHAFPETEPVERLPIMHSFFARQRSDQACLVFGHMRQQQDIEARPNDEAYAQCFYGIAQCRDVDGLQMIHNMLKMDIYVEPTTKIRNSMMAAYTACQTPFRAIIDHYWKILDSREGPTLSSFKLALRACEVWVGAGGEEARRIMALMQKWNLIITKDIYECYIGALAGQSQFENAIELIDCMEEDIGVAPDAVTIGTFYNTIPWQYRKDEVEAWAKVAYPDLWEELLTFGDEIDEEWEVRYFKINRSIDVDDELLFGGGHYSPALAEEFRLRLPSPTAEEAA